MTTVAPCAGSASPGSSEGDGAPSLALLVGAARSGTTLLRMMLDGHPEIAAPGEVGIPGLIQHLWTVWRTIDGNTYESPGSCPPEVRSAIAAATIAPMTHYCRPRRKRIYVDKSLDSVHHLTLLRDFVPDGRYIMLYRHVLDTVLSGIEASPWGFQGYGYAPYVHATNTVAGLVQYWVDHVSPALEWERAHPEQCLRVRYEAFVRDPARTLVELHHFLGVSEHPEGTSAPFDREPERTPGDYKILGTTEVHRASVGRGKRVPVQMIPPPLRTAANELLRELGYDELNETWNVTPAQELLASATPQMETRLGDLLSSRCRRRLTLDGQPIAIVATDTARPGWLLRPGDGQVEHLDPNFNGGIIAGSVDDLITAIAGGENVHALMRTGRIRYGRAGRFAETDGKLSPEEWKLVPSVLKFLRTEG
ncbi:MAG: sulfotransferase family protein [Solirubrobacteraceae bacterium]